MRFLTASLGGAVVPVIDRDVFPALRGGGSGGASCDAVVSGGGDGVRGGGSGGGRRVPVASDTNFLCGAAIAVSRTEQVAVQVYPRARALRAYLGSERQQSTIDIYMIDI